MYQYNLYLVTLIHFIFTFKNTLLVKKGTLKQENEIYILPLLLC